MYMKHKFNYFAFMLSLILNFLSRIQIIYAIDAVTCRSYNQRCLITLGTPLTNPNANNVNSTFDFPLEMAVRDSIYFSIQVKYQKK